MRKKDGRYGIINYNDSFQMREKEEAWVNQDISMVHLIIRTASS